MRQVYRMTSDLTPQEIQDILYVLNGAFGNWGDLPLFHWKYSLNVHGESLHMVTYEGCQPVGTVSFWRNDLGNQRAYECVDGAVLPSHQRKGIFRDAASGCVARLREAYLYAYPNQRTLPALMSRGWSVKNRITVNFHLARAVLGRYECRDPLPEKYMEWRFVRHPKKQYYVYRHHGHSFLLTKRRKGGYSVGGLLSADCGLKEARPPVLFSRDFPDLPLRIPRRTNYLLENTCYVKYDGFIPSYTTDTF